MSDMSELKDLISEMEESDRKKVLDLADQFRAILRANTDHAGIALALVGLEEQERIDAKG